MIPQNYGETKLSKRSSNGRPVLDQDVSLTGQNDGEEQLEREDKSGGWWLDDGWGGGIVVTKHGSFVSAVLPVSPAIIEKISS